MKGLFIRGLKIAFSINKASQTLGLAIMMSIFLGFGFLFAAVDIPEREVKADVKSNDKVIESVSREVKADVKSNAKVKEGVFREETTVADKLISSTFKSLAKAFVATTNIEKLKKDNIEKLNKKDEAKFRKQYIKIYSVVRECSAIRERYGLTEDLTRDQAVEKIKGLKKKDMYEALNLIPDSVIANQFRLYLQEKKQEIAGSNVVEQIKQLWTKMTSDAFGSKQKRK